MYLFICQTKAGIQQHPVLQNTPLNGLIMEGFYDVCVCVCVCVSRSVVPDSLQSHGLQPTRLHYPGDFLGKDTEVVCYFPL